MRFCSVAYVLFPTNYHSRMLVGFCCSFVFRVLFCLSCLVWPLYCLFLVELRLLVTPLLSLSLSNVNVPCIYTYNDTKLNYVILLYSFVFSLSFLPTIFNFHSENYTSKLKYELCRHLTSIHFRFNKVFSTYV